MKLHTSLVVGVGKLQHVWTYFLVTYSRLQNLEVAQYANFSVNTFLRFLKSPLITNKTVQTACLLVSAALAIGPRCALSRIPIKLEPPIQSTPRAFNPDPKNKCRLNHLIVLRKEEEKNTKKDENWSADRRLPCRPIFLGRCNKTLYNLFWDRIRSVWGEKKLNKHCANFNPGINLLYSRTGAAMAPILIEIEQKGAISCKFVQ